MTLILPLKVNGGAEIRETSDQAQHIADILGCHVEFYFNEVTCSAVPGGFGELLASRQQAEQGRKLTTPFDRRFARSL